MARQSIHGTHHLASENTAENRGLFFIFYLYKYHLDFNIKLGVLKKFRDKIGYWKEKIIFEFNLAIANGIFSLFFSKKSNSDNINKKE